MLRYPDARKPEYKPEIIMAKYGTCSFSQISNFAKHVEDVLIPESGQSMGRLHTVYMCHSWSLVSCCNWGVCRLPLGRHTVYLSWVLCLGSVRLGYLQHPGCMSLLVEVCQTSAAPHPGFSWPSSLENHLIVSLYFLASPTLQVCKGSTHAWKWFN